MLNWETGGDHLSSHIVMTETAGFKHIGDFLKARNPGAKGAEKIFDDKYTPAELKGGRDNGRNYLVRLLGHANRGEYVFGLFNRYTKLWSWPVLRELILNVHKEMALSSGFEEVTHIFHDPTRKGDVPSEFILFCCGTVQSCLALSNHGPLLQTLQVEYRIINALRLAKQLALRQT